MVKQIRRAIVERVKRAAVARKQAQAYTREETKLAPIGNVIRDAREKANG